MATTHRSELIDELEKALHDEVYDGGLGALPPDQLTDYVRRLAVTAAKVAEEVHTPTDDEYLRTPDPQGEPSDAQEQLAEALYLLDPMKDDVNPLGDGTYDDSEIVPWERFVERDPEWLHPPSPRCRGTAWAGASVPAAPRDGIRPAGCR
ncbi:hypothetical protein [Microbacterium sp. K36]|uniref:hypothetical protein n=1 Tax=Microbacterium sp. K36 TaxID=2305439 RepID=UPI00109C8180|nr:hypothetical protein [Microbacterium sp. K36]